MLSTVREIEIQEHAGRNVGDRVLISERWLTKLLDVARCEPAYVDRMRGEAEILSITLGDDGSAEPIWVSCRVRFACGHEAYLAPDQFQ